MAGIGVSLLRRITLAIDTRSGKRDYGYRRLFRVATHIRVLQNLTLTSRLFVDLWEIGLRPGRQPTELVGIFSIREVAPVDAPGSRLAVVRGRLHGFLKRFYFGYGVHIAHPIDFQEDRLTITIFGTRDALDRALRYLAAGGIRSQVTTAGPHLFAGAGLDRLLTRRQREVVAAAHAAGYYEVPRRTDARALARRLGITHQSVVECLRRAERRVMDEIAAGEPPA